MLGVSSTQVVIYQCMCSNFQDVVVHVCLAAIVMYTMILKVFHLHCVQNSSIMNYEFMFTLILITIIVNITTTITTVLTITVTINITTILFFAGWQYQEL